GGPSFAIYVHEPPAGASTFEDTNVLVHGNGGVGGFLGSGGASPSSRGTPGVDGASGTTSW
ncbi:MAG: hypothetical protein KC656_29425, partial [Myxococcales bacterium]|nr:hypothetical protein [Myxococcales bacterium]